jgi:hypothetical protein
MEAERRPRDEPTRDQADVLRLAAVAATLAHSSRDSEPWRIEIGHDALDLYADDDQWLSATDVTGQAQTLSVGCALLNARVVIEAAGFGYKVVRLPDAGHPQHLATVHVTSHWPEVGQTGPGAGLSRLGSDGFSRYGVDRLVTGRPTPVELAELGSAVTAEGAFLHQVDATTVAVATAHNRGLDWLVAGEAVQRLVLEAALLGLGSEEVEEEADPAASLSRLRARMGGTDHPQAVLRLGAPGRRSRGRRRPLADVLRSPPA